MPVDDLAEHQYGVITRAQAAEHLSESAIDRRLRAKRWVPMFPGIYRVSGAPQTSQQRMLAVSLWAMGPISHLSAGKLLHLDGLPAPVWTDVTVDRKTGIASQNIVVHRAKLTRLDRVSVDGIACTSATRTLFDCAPLVNGEQLETAFEHARRMGLTSIRAVEQRISRARPGSALMREVLRHVQARPRESRLEVKLARLLRKSGLPQPIAQFEVGEYRLDHAWTQILVACECDGFTWHGNRLQWKRDRRRVAILESFGWRIVHVTWDDVTERPGETLDRLAIAIARAA